MNASPNQKEIEMSNEKPVFEGVTENGIEVRVRLRNDGYQVFVGGWRVATLKTEAGAIRRAERTIDEGNAKVAKLAENGIAPDRVERCVDCGSVILRPGSSPEPKGEIRCVGCGAAHFLGGQSGHSYEEA